MKNLAGLERKENSIFVKFKRTMNRAYRKKT